MGKVGLLHPDALLYEYSYTAAVPELGCLLNDVLYRVDLSVSGYTVLSSNSAVSQKVYYPYLSSMGNQWKMSLMPLLLGDT